MITELAITLGAGGVGTIVGFFTCAALTAGKVADAQADAGLWETKWQQDYAKPRLDASAAIEQSSELHAAHARCSDSRNVLLSKIEDIRELLNRPRTIRKGELASILDGEVA